MLQVKNLSFKYPKYQNNVLNQISFNVQDGCHLAVIGHNGSGKSTLVKLLGGFLKAKKGTIFFNDKELTSVGFNKIGILLQDPDVQLLADTLHQELIFTLENHGVLASEMDKIINEVLTVVELKDKQFTPLKKLSFGEKQRAVFACLLAVKPQIYLLDEAFSMLDNKISNKLKKFVFDTIKKQNKIVINITHDFNDLFLADEIIFLSKGSLIKKFAPEAIYEQLDLFHNHHFNLPFPLLLAHKVAKQINKKTPSLSFELNDVVNWICKHLK
ncbi:energy-coupling factor ABC transporter ATP-binding protein [Mycoplasmoides genitalium]